MSIHSCSLGAPILSRGSKSCGGTAKPASPVATPAVDAMRAVGQWNTAWDPFFEIDPGWTDDFFARGARIYKSGVMPAKEVELLSIAFDASFTHMYAPGTRRHIKAALKAGATMEEVMEARRSSVSCRACRRAISACRFALKELERAKSKPSEGDGA